MAGIHFSFDNFEQLIDLNIGIADRLDENRAERFTILYCDFGGLNLEVVEKSLAKTLRNSDSVVNYVNDYFFVLPYTDQFGAQSVRGLFEAFFNVELPSVMASYPSDGENPQELLAEIQHSASRVLSNDLVCLNELTQRG
ncbi:hypothetical protein [Sulfurimonas sp. C5]|uniref:hypothetical protein n=1 Tax=Sulfurimonas sp. C5 TaxID=3036947 RepID=UPI002455EC32|nr:hypothetical protein [Sulfurimonas sp. C5]MDH4944856.1 hypothetical protein [Sulfurimonas sp. C5]